MVAGREVSPQDVANTERLMRYWSEGPGAAKLQWGVPGDYDKCLVELGKYVSDPHELHGLCANLHHRATGGWPGHAPGIEESEAEAKKRSLYRALGPAFTPGRGSAIIRREQGRWNERICY